MMYFNPKIVHLDFEDALSHALLNEDLFDKKPLIIKCMFHYSKAIKNMMIKKQLCSKKLNIKSMTILRNLEIFLFIDPKQKNKFKKILEEHLNKTNEHKNFYQYFLKNWINKSSDYYSYYNILQYFEKKDEVMLNYFYTTNNTAESLHSKINRILGKGITSNLEFVKSIPKIFAIISNKKDIPIRYDFITKNIISLIKKFNLNESYRWVELKEFNDNLKNIIKGNKKNKNINNFERLYDYISNDLSEHELDNNESDKINLLNNENQIINKSEIKDESKEEE